MINYAGVDRGVHKTRGTVLQQDAAVASHC
jgi:hypothetical protein